MAIPTQFSVAKTRKCPLANPHQPVDGANPLTAEDVGFISGASVLPAKSAGDIGAPVELTSQAAADIDNASLFSALSIGAIDNPSIVTAESVAPVDSASVIDAELEAVIYTPTPFTAKAGTLVAPPFPLNHARILYKNKLKEYVSVTQNKAGNPVYALTKNTAQRWEFSVSGEDALWSVTMPSDYAFDTVCVCAHNLADIGATLQVNYDPEPIGGYNQFGSDITPTTNAPIMIHLPAGVPAIRIQIQVKNGNGNGYIGYISAGVALQMQRPFFNGHTPFTDSDVTEYYSKRTESGERIGRDIRRKGFETSFEWQNIDDGWYRQYIPEFKSYAKIDPIVVAWNLLEYPLDVAFGETTDDMSAPMQNGTRTKRSGFGFTLAGV